MEKGWLFIIGIFVIIVLTAIAFFGITSITGSAIYGKCWHLEKPLTQSSEMILKMQGCVVDKDNSKVCCPFDSCPSAEEIKCGP
jgi:hypothetical protein